MAVDNDARNVEIIASVLRYLGFSSVTGVADGFKAIETMHEYDTDLLITDWELRQTPENTRLTLPPNPVIRSDKWATIIPDSGIALTRYIRLSKYSPNRFIPVIMMAGIGMENCVEHARDAGVNEILLKPLIVESLCERITRIIDTPRPFITSEHYWGPCRRHNDGTSYTGIERRTHDVMLYKHSG